VSLSKTEVVAPEATIEDQVAFDLSAAHDLADQMARAWSDYIEKKISVSPQRHHRASSFGEPCDRKLYHDIVDWDKKEPVSRGLQQLFERGHAHEPIVIQIMANLGFRLIGEQRDWYDEDCRISARIEGHWVHEKTGRPLLAEIKSSVDFGLTRCETLAQLLKSPRGRKYYTQFQTYLHHFELYAGLLLIWDVGAWAPILIPIPFDIDKIDWIIKRAKRLNDLIDAETPPDYHSDPRECRRCHHYGRACVPPLAFGEGTLFLNEPVLLAKIERAEKLEVAGREWTRLVKQIKDQVRDMGERSLIGEFLITNEQSQRTDYKVPAEIKAKYKTTEPQTRTVWKRIPERKAAKC